ncbi:MAG: phenylalanine 4-monooxygenase [Bacteriovoracaceae bacterium]|nr:phenylalanine 4-monooxygenase [Bacteriovoracaceae bacterium]
MKTTYVSKRPNAEGLIDWTADENKTWNTLITRQAEIVKTRACPEFLEGLERIGFSQDRVPQHTEINRRLKDFSGWEVEVVPALIPAKEFFTLLANKKFPAASFIRLPQELDYIQEPDIFHEFYGHVPLLTFSDYANFMEEFGKLALSISPKDRRRIFRLFWFTIEFGLLKTPQGIKAYGGGMLSSIHETVYSVESPLPKRVDFDPLTALRTPYRIDIPQPLYYVLDNFSDLFKILDQDILRLLEKSKELGDFAPLFEPAGEEL